MSIEITALEAIAEVCRLEEELNVATTALTETTNQLCEALTTIAFLKGVQPTWKSAIETKQSGLEFEIEALREELQRYTSAQMQ